MQQSFVQSFNRSVAQPFQQYFQPSSVAISVTMRKHTQHAQAVRRMLEFATVVPSCINATRCGAFGGISNQSRKRDELPSESKQSKSKMLYRPLFDTWRLGRLIDAIALYGCSAILVVCLTA
jgi:hypothetical protein